MKKPKNENDCLREQRSYLLELRFNEMDIGVPEVPLRKINYSTNWLTELINRGFLLLFLKWFSILKISFSFETVWSGVGWHYIHLLVRGYYAGKGFCMRPDIREISPEPFPIHRCFCSFICDVYVCMQAGCT